MCMSQKITFTVQPRNIQGKKVKKIRSEGKIPANVYGDVKESMAIQVDTLDFRNLYKEAGETGVVFITIEGQKESRPVMIDQVDKHPVTHTIQHVSFRQVSLKEKIDAEVPLEFVGEVDIPETFVDRLFDVIEVKSLPTDIPERFEVDVSVLSEVGQEITVADLHIGSNEVEVLLDPDTVVARLQEITIEEIEEPEPELVEGEEGVEVEEEGETEEEESLDKEKQASEEKEEKKE